MRRCYLWYNINDMKQTHFSKNKLKSSFTNAWRGWRIMQGEQSFMLQLALGAIAIILSFAFHLSAVEFSVIILSIGFVLTLEILNTIIENWLDFIYPKRHPKVALIKDATAWLVLAGSIMALIIGLIIFGAHL